MKQKRKKKKRIVLNFYYFCVTFPERVYPFASKIRGERVRWQRSYEHTIKQIEKQFGKGRYGIKLSVYRELCHIFGSALFILAATLISNLVWGSTALLPAMFFAAMLAITYQEFYFHPRHYEQRFGKSVVDWASWVIPLYLYLLIFTI